MHNVFPADSPWTHMGIHKHLWFGVDGQSCGVLGNWANGGQNYQGAGSRMGKNLGSRGSNLGIREQRKKSKEQGAEEIEQEATQKFLREQGDSKK